MQILARKSSKPARCMACWRPNAVTAQNAENETNLWWMPWARLVIFDSFAADSEQQLRSELLQVIRENVSFNPAQSRFWLDYSGREIQRIECINRSTFGPLQTSFVQPGDGEHGRGISHNAQIAPGRRFRVYTASRLQGLHIFERTIPPDGN